MNKMNRRSFTALMAGASADALIGIPALAQGSLSKLSLLAPSSPGSGYDQLARAMQQILQQDGQVSSVEVQNMAGGGGTVGLAQFVTSRASGPSAMIVGFALIGGILTTQSAVTLEDTKPLARLMGEMNTIVVPANSSIKSLDDLIAALREAPGNVSWAGGSIGGVDHVTAGLFAKAVGVDPAQINYVVHAGGGEVLASVLGGHATLGISGFEEFRAQIDAGQLVPLAVSGEERIPGIDVPTFKEAGVDLAVLNWRGIVAHPDTSDEDMAAMSATIAQLMEAPAWKDLLAARNWLPNYLPADDFATFLSEEATRIGGALKEAGVI